MYFGGAVCLHHVDLLRSLNQQKLQINFYQTSSLIVFFRIHQRYWKKVSKGPIGAVNKHFFPIQIYCKSSPW